MVLSHRWLVLMVWALVVAVGGLMFSLIRSELAPLEDRAVIFGRLQSPPGNRRLHLGKPARGRELL